MTIYKEDLTMDYRCEDCGGHVIGEYNETVYCPVHPSATVVSLVINPAAILGAKGGQTKSEAKTKAARENAKKGGRPRKNLPAKAAIRFHVDHSGPSPKEIYFVQSCDTVKHANGTIAFDDQVIFGGTFGRSKTLKECESWLSDNGYSQVGEDREFERTTIE